MPTFKVRATPVQVTEHEGYRTVSFELFAQNNELAEVFVPSPSALAEVLCGWAYGLELPTVTRHGDPSKTNAWSVSVVKPARWPSGYKAAGERHHTFVVQS